MNRTAKGGRAADFVTTGYTLEQETEQRQRSVVAQRCDSALLERPDFKVRRARDWANGFGPRVDSTTVATVRGELWQSWNK